MNIKAINTLNNHNATVNNTEEKVFANKHNQAFGYQERSQSKGSTIKDVLLILTNSAVGLAGFNTVLAGMQRVISGKVLIGKINNHFMKNISPEENSKLLNLAENMWKESGLKGKGVKLNSNGPIGEAYFTHIGNKVVVGPDKYSALFHEFGHAIEENFTNNLKKLQRFRGHYGELSLFLYFLMAIRPKKKENNKNPENQTFGDKVKNSISKSNALIPLVAFSPELVTEGMATHKGLDFLRKQLKDGKITKKLFTNIKNSYYTCFMTYLFAPISIMLLDVLRRNAYKAAAKHNIQQTPYYYY